jgi:hypothetical protein
MLEKMTANEAPEYPNKGAVGGHWTVYDKVALQIALAQALAILTNM